MSVESEQQGSSAVEHRAHNPVRVGSSPTPASKPLFIPLKAEFYDAFADGSKTVEYRRYGPRWNARTCQRGRAVVLSKGYGKRHRMRGTITGFMVSNYPTQTDAWKKCYGDSTDFAACITIQVDRGGPNSGAK